MGCGAGALSAALKEAGATHVAGVEIDPEAAARHEPASTSSSRAAPWRRSFRSRPGEFDYLIFGDVLEHLPEPEAALERYLSYLAPDGRVIVSVPNMRFYLVLLRLIFDRWSYTDSGVRDRTHLRIFTRRSLMRMLSESGLEVERMRRNHRLFEDQSQIGRAGALATRLTNATIARFPFRDLLAFQYVAVCRRAGPTATADAP